MSAQAFATSLPIIGTTLSSALSGATSTLVEAQSLANQINSAITSLENDIDSNTVLTADLINTKINAALASAGFAGSVSTAIDDNNITLTFNTSHHDSATVNLGGSLGLGALSLQTNGTATASLDYSFGFSAVAGNSDSFQNGSNGHVTNQPYTSDDQFYDSTGVLTSFTRFYSNGDEQAHETVSSGVRTIDYFDANETLTMETVTQPGGSKEVKDFAIANEPYSQDDRMYDASGALTSLTRFHDDGSKQYEKTISGGTTTVDEYDLSGNVIKETITHPDQSQDVSTFGIVGKAYFASHLAYDPSHTLLEVDYSMNDGSRTVVAKAHGQTLVSSSQADNFTSFGTEDVFVFRPASGNDTVNHFNAGSQAGHDTIEIDASLANSISDLDIAPINNNHDVRITIDDHDSITVKGVHVSDLQQDIVLVPHV